MTTLIDGFGRPHDNLRISVTDRCNLRCTYCMEEEVTFLPREQLLTFEEITDFVRVAADLGIRKLRLTGGEPLLRRHLYKLVALLAAVPGINDIALTTNGLLLAEQAGPLRDAGLTRVTVSLDTLDPIEFRRVARREGLDRVLAGIDAARQAGFSPVKLNAVSMRGLTEHAAGPLARWARDEGHELRFIEAMPIGTEQWDVGGVFPAHELLELLEREVAPLAPSPDYDPRAPAMLFEYASGGRVGIVASVTRSFCANCDRLRLTAEGALRNCLFALNEIDVRPSLRPELHVDALTAALRQSVASKWAGHGIGESGFVKPLRTMHAIGG